MQDIRQIRAALRIVRESRKLALRLSFSISSASSRSVPKKYLQEERRKLIVLFMVTTLKIYAKQLIGLLATAIAVALAPLHVFWQWISELIR